MPARPDLPETEQRRLTDFGARLRLARQRRHLTVQQVADQAGVTRVTLYRAESGDAAVTLGTYAKVLAALDMGTDVTLLARDDHAGHRLQDERLPARRLGTRFPRRIRLAKYPQLQAIAWGLQGAADVSPTEAFQLYERNWRHVDVVAMETAERTLLDQLTATIGKGVLNV